MRREFEESYNKFITGISNEDINLLTERAKLYMTIWGAMFRDRNEPNTSHIIPVTLFPSPFPKELFQRTRLLQTHVNILMHKLSNDLNFITNGLKEVCVEDNFTKRLVDIYQEAYQYKFSQKIAAGIIRSDYMTNDLNNPCCELPDLFLVEYNTISVSFGAHGSQIQDIHKDVLYHARSIFDNSLPEFVPDKDKARVFKDIGQTLAISWTEYVKKYNPADTCIIFVLQENERNVFDHTKIESATIKYINQVLFQNFTQKKPPRIFFLTLKQLADQLRVSDDCGALYYHLNGPDKTPIEVALLYFRSCYTPADFTSEKCWETRRTIELSRSIKVPSIGLQLAGTKKVQQLLAQEGVLEEYLPKEISEYLRKTYTGIYSLDNDNPNLEQLLKDVRANPDNYVLKPQREGGGNNIYGADIVIKIQQMLSANQNLGEYIIMDMIKPTVYKNYIVRFDSPVPTLCDCINELGAWGMFVSNEGDISFNISSGYLLRSKSVQQLDGGVASGRAVLDSVCLY